MSNNNKDTTNKSQEETKLMKCLIESGERDRLKQNLRQQLVNCGWRDDMLELCRQQLEEGDGSDIRDKTVSELVALLKPRAKAAVPEEVKSQLLKDVRKSAKKLNIL